MKSLVILVVTSTIATALRDPAPGFAVDFRTFGGPRIYQDLPYRDQPRLFREAGPPPGQRQTYQPETFREYRPAFSGREESRFHNERFKDEAREGFKEDLRTFSEDEIGPYREENPSFKDENRGFNEDPRNFQEDRLYRDGLMRERPGNFQERPFRDEPRSFRDDLRNFRDNPYKDESKLFGDDLRGYDGPRPFRDDSRLFRNEVRPYSDEPSGFREDRPFREESSGLRNEPRPFHDDARPFKDELLFTQESRGLAHHRYPKEHRQPLSYGGHSNYLKYGNHGLGYASIPSSVLPLEEDSSRLSSGMMITEMSTAATQSPNFIKSNIQETPNPNSVQSSITSSHVSVTLAPDVRSTPSQSTSDNPMTHNQRQTNENLVDGGSISGGSSNPVTISTSASTSVTPKVLFTSGPISGTSMRINSVENNSVHQGPMHDTLQADKQAMNVVPPAYFQSEGRPEVPGALLNYVFKYPMPEEPKIRYTYSSPQPEVAFNGIQSLIQHHQSPKYTDLPELKISGLSTIGQTVNYVPNTVVPKFLNPADQGINLNSYAAQTVPSVKFTGNLIQLDREPRYSPIDHQLTALQSNQFSTLRHFGHNEYLPQLGQYTSLGQQQTNVPFTQGLGLQLAGFGGLEYRPLTNGGEASRETTSVNLGSNGFAKIPFGQSM